MLKKILLLSNKKTNFLSTTIKTYLQEEDFDVMFAGFDEEEVGRLKEIPTLILLNFEDIEDKDKQFLSYVRDICMKEEKWVYLCGHESEISYVSSVLPKGAVAGTCSRPFDFPKMINGMIREMQDEDRQQMLITEDYGKRVVDVSMFRKILLLNSKKTSFLSTTIRTRLQQENFEVMFAGFDMDEVSKIRDKPNLMLLNFEEIEAEDKQFLYYIRDLCVEDEKRVYLCGYEKDINEVVSILPKGAVIGTFVRPFNISDLINGMNKEIERYSKDQGKKHILVVDDSGEMLRAIRTWLSDSYRVSVVNSGANAILFLANQKPDLILLDFEMPFCSGPQMMEMIRAESSTSTIPVMFLTGKSDKESLMKVLSLKPEGYMLKTTSPEKIKETIHNFFVAQKGKTFNKGT